MQRFLGVILGLVFASILPAVAEDAAATLRDRADRLEVQGEYRQAIDAVERYVAVVRDRNGEYSVGYILALARLAKVRGRAGDEKLSEELFKRAIQLSGSVTGVHTAVKANILTELASFYRQRGRDSEAEEFFKQAHEVGRNDPTVSSAYSGNLLNFYVTTMQYEKARRFGETELLLLEAKHGTESLELARVLQELGRTYKHLGHADLARQLFRRLIHIYVQFGGPSREKDAADALIDLGRIDISEGKYSDGEASYRRAIEIFEKRSPIPNDELARSLAALADCLVKQGRHEEAATHYERAIGLVSSLNQLAFWWWDLGQIKRKLNDYSAAEQLFKKARSALEKSHGDQGTIAFVTAELGTLYRLTGKYPLAEEEYKAAIGVAKKAFGAESQVVGRMHINLALVYSDQRQSDAAHDALSVALDILTRRRMRSEVESVGYAPKSATSDSEDTRTLIKTLFHVLTPSRPRTVELMHKSFQLAQLGLQTSASGALAQLSARLVSGKGELAELIRARQAKIAEWGVLNRAAMGGGVAGGAARALPEKLGHRHQLLTLEQEITGIELRLLKEFPNYAEFANPRPMDVASVRELMADDEALIVFLDTDAWSTIPAQTFVWVVTKTDMRWVRSALGTTALTREVAALRCGLDAALWDDDETAKPCRNLLKAEPQRDMHNNVRTETLPFDAARAHALYKSLLGQVDDLIRAKHLLIAPSGALTQLPFQVLVTAAPSGAGHRATRWLARKHAITVLPAVSSLKALRSVAKLSAARKPMLGIGNPLLDGNPAARPWEAEWAKRARDKQACPHQPAAPPRSAGLSSKRRVAKVAMTRDGRADIAHLRSQVPLYDTADELCVVAKDLRLAADDILLGARATEATLKGMNLTQYRVLHFATHGTIAGEITGTNEPGLILTPPKEQTELDDGYLSASEVAALKLDAEWVILSACNTAAGGAQGAEALSGLARAFIYAGARALLVSHWSVDSAATVKLITSAVGAITRDSKLGRAEALRRAMLAMIDNGIAREAHPAYWAPFIVVGEGAAR